MDMKLLYLSAQIINCYFFRFEANVILAFCEAPLLFVRLFGLFENF